ncbi:hypothetical protein MCOR27_001494 [Pyricularia oryzae]|nr:hypothetical protein MCOR01_010563 [Pyricularia oryzae]KAI6301148.1 hypothetical protein MCOR33_003324 [Pyricularia grisea]KAI6262122.1 hypothetical protein MCOR19_001636 [Pyricularia oryzae]KAI6276625.1 hypothetical protein MCOR26_005528 [Pyricularia oryzae]KAI6287041.1 hypothetical protein MCOR27_001494 [Pyricularia oryzae]
MLGGMPKPPGGLAPPVPGNRMRSNSDHGRSDSTGSAGGLETSAPQLGGLFAGGMPKLRKTGGGVDTGANRDASYLSDPENSAGSAPKPPSMSAPKPPSGAAPRVPGRPGVPAPQVGSTSHPSIANLRKNPSDVQRPFSSASMMKGPPPPIGKKPPPPPGSRKPSSIAVAPPAPPSAPPAPPPPPPSAAPRPPPAPSRGTPPPPAVPPSSGPSSNGAAAASLAVQAAIRAASSPSSAPAAPPPPPPPPVSRGNSNPTSPPPPPPSSGAPPPPSSPVPPPPRPAQHQQQPSASRAALLDPAAFTLTPNGGKLHSPTRSLSGARPGTAGGDGANGGGMYVVHDPRWKFVGEDKFPKPREFSGGAKRYRAGRGSSVPLDLRSLG